MSDINLPKIGWQNGTLISKAKVEINGVIYEVEPEEYSGSTPLSAENLIQMENNTEGGLNTILHLLEGTTLYSDNIGTNGNVTLSEDISNMKRLRILGYVVINDIKYNFLQEVNVVFDGKVGILFKGSLGGTYNYIVGEPIELNTTSITRGGQELIGFDRNGGVYRTDAPIYITKVIGFNY